MDEDSRKRMLEKLLADETRFEMSRMMDAIRDSLKYFGPKAVPVITNQNGGPSS